MSNINILFHSNYCEGSKQLLSLLQSENLVRFFHLICVDNNLKIPPQIKVTPTLILREVPIPYVAGDAFVWFAKIKQWKINMTMQSMNTAQQQYLQNINNNLGGNNSMLLGFNDSEMNGMSDIFSFFAKNIEQECQNALPQSFFMYNNIGKEFIETRPLDGGSYKVSENKHKITKEQQKEMITKLDVARKRQDDIFKQNIDNFMKQYNNN